MLEQRLAQGKYNEIIQHTALFSIEMTPYAQDLLGTLSSSKLTTICSGFNQPFNIVLNHDAGFIEITVYHL
ncbi:hypothetical protein BCV72DRAFT_319455 [Rhizopus microsporus var. microsporus]|uniref:Uncharacterized protein n=1 Tax=Rhizopus microsporus var. microsporus TaxID=86635 RepID=A0A1X0QQI8_RHIZD|nr:hypothetical protein BCV72DRAFT_319455 [Rhizopus microsporus var. microsporus]